MGITRSRRHKHRATGGRFPMHKKKRKYEMGRPPANTKLGIKRIRLVRCRGGNIKFRALRLDAGNYSWGSENISRKCRLLDVVYNASNNELVRTKMLVKNAIVLIDATPFKQWFRSYYGLDLGKKKQEKKEEGKKGEKKEEKKEEEKKDEEKKKEEKKEEEKKDEEKKDEEKKPSRHLLVKQKFRQKNLKLDSAIEEQIAAGKILACVSSRPGQCGRCDGYILEGAELHFYKRKMDKKKHK